MPKLKLTYDFKHKKIASTLLSLGLTEFEAASTLIDKTLYREAVVHMYFTCFYLTQTLLQDYLKAKPSHKAVQMTLHEIYGRSPNFPRRYIDLHTSLHELRTTVDYKTTHVPSPYLLKRKLRVLNSYVQFVSRNVPKVDTLEILRNVYESNKKDIKDFSYDIYCPKTYSHHTRITFWQPPSYLGLYSPEQLAKHTRSLLRTLRVRRCGDYVVGLNSKLNQYKPVHLIMLDIDSLDPSVESALKDIGGVLLKTGRGFHFIGNEIIDGQREWISLMKKIKRDKNLKQHLDKDHIEISMRRGYATLRITASPVKPTIPVFFKEL